MTDGVFSVIHPAGTWQGANDSVTLSYEERMLRRKRLATDDGGSIMIDLPQVATLAAGDALGDAGGRLVEVRAADEPLLQVRGDLPRLAWHVGNRHTPCQIEADRLLIRDDHVLRDMLRHLGAHVEKISAPFMPEGGAYGHGRTMGHEHGPHDHVHDGGGHDGHS